VDALQKVISLTAEQFDELVKNGSLVVGGETKEFSSSGLYLTPSRQLYRYHIKITKQLEPSLADIFEFDIYSQNSKLFYNATTDAQKYAIISALYNGQNIPVAYSNSRNLAYGSVSMTIIKGSFAGIGTVYDFSTQAYAVVNSSGDFSSDVVTVEISQNPQ
jgi:hypothetical protein